MRDSIKDQLRRNTVAIISLAVAITSLGYATWRNEATEANRNVRTAGFAVIERLASLDEVALFIRYSGDGTSADTLETRRKEGWIHIIALRDLCFAMPPEVTESADALYEVWQRQSGALRTAQGYEQLNAAIEATRKSTLGALRALD